MFKLLNGESIPPGEIKLLNEVFPPELTKALLDNRTLGRKILEGTTEAINIPRAIMSSTDLSAAFRQAVFVLPKQLIKHPIRTTKTFLRQVKQAFSEADFRAGEAEIRSRPTYNKMKEYDIGLSDLNAKVGVREEALGSNMAEKIPLFGRVFKASEAAFNGGALRMRADLADWNIRMAESKGKNMLDPVEAEGIGKLVNQSISLFTNQTNSN